MNAKQQVNKQLLSRLTHHVRNPFNGIIGFTDLLQNHFYKLSDDDKLNYLQIVHQLSKKALLRSENLAWWLKFFTDNFTPVPQSFDLSILVQEELNYFTNETQKQHLDIETDLGSGIMVNTDKMMVQSVLKNILMNIIEFAPSGDNVDIILTQANNNVVVTFTNTFKDNPSDETQGFIAQMNEETDLLKMPENPGLWTINALCKKLEIDVSVSLDNQHAKVVLTFNA
jgi:signal transduction histidine kinase